MVDPTDFSAVNEAQWNLEENLLFWICVAGKGADQTAHKINRFLCECLREAYPPNGDWMSEGWLDYTPFDLVQKMIDQGKLEQKLRSVKMGKYTLLTRAFAEVIKLDPRTCSVEELERVHGIGPKTARCFLMHSRSNQRYAGIDTHVLKFLRHHGFDAPKTTPPAGPSYRRWEEHYLQLADRLHMDPTVLDLTVWKHYAGREQAPAEIFVLGAI